MTKEKKQAGLVGHAPTPWAMRPAGDDIIITESDFVIARITDAFLCQGEDAANAAFIVRAVNAYDDLVSALQGLEGIAYEIHTNQYNTMNLQVMAGAGLYARIEAAWAALRKAEGK